MIVDTHCHLYDKEFAADISEVMEQAHANNVHAFYLPAIDSETTEAMLMLENSYPGQCFAMMGLHPCSVKENYLEELRKVAAWLARRKFAAIGETGLDFYWDTSFVKEQYIALEKQIEFALQYELPIVLHTRNSTTETIEVIKNYVSQGLRGIFHCFGGTMQEASQIIEAGFYLGIGGVVTYKNSGLAQVIKEIDLNNIVLETDAPYLAPAPHRGKRNESGYLKFIIEKIADIKNTSVEEVAMVTTANAKKIFG